MRISDWSSDVCSSDLLHRGEQGAGGGRLDAHPAAMIQQQPTLSGRSLAGSAASSRMAMRGLRPLTSGRRWRGGADFSGLPRCGSGRRSLLGPPRRAASPASPSRSEEHTSELQSLMRISYAVFCLTKKQTNNHNKSDVNHTVTYTQ